jgi:DUF4097 and DUF4098 domain-containing protein YvlB
VSVEGWDKNELWISVRPGDDVERIEIDNSASRPEIRVVVPKRKARKISTDIDVRMPFGASLEISGVSMDARVRGIEGDVDLHSVSGTVMVNAEGGEVDAETVSGDVRVGGRAESIEANTSSGTVFISGETPDLRAETISGDVRVEGRIEEGKTSTTSGTISVKGHVRDLEAQTISGDVRVETLGARGEVSTVSGTVRVAGELLERLEVGSISGDIEVDTMLTPDAEVDLETKSGRVALRVPRDTPAHYELKSFSGNLRNEFGGQAERRNGPGRELVFSEGEGSADVEMSSMSGDLTLLAR